MDQGSREGRTFCFDVIISATIFAIPLKLTCPLSIYPFSQEQWNNLPASVFSEHCSLDTFKAHVSCLSHLPVYNPIKLTFFF